jgi:hypothetical protein
MQLVAAIRDQKPPEVNVTVPVTVKDRKGKTKTKVTKHDAKGRILEFEQEPGDEE